MFVAGGGPAGTAAAVAARSQGATVFLAEAHTCLGGMGTAARVPLFMPLTDGVNFLPGGYGRQVVDRLKMEASLAGRANDNEALKRVYDSLVTESGAEFSFYTTLIAVEAEAGRVSHVICAAPGGMFAVRARCFVDATGNGDLAVMAGAKYEKGDADGKLMPGTLCSVWCDIDWKTWLANRPKGPQPDGHMLEKAFADLKVHGSLRVMPGCFITGQAAGIAAAIAAQGEISAHRLDVTNLQQRLKVPRSIFPTSELAKRTPVIPCRGLQPS